MGKLNVVRMQCSLNCEIRRKYISHISGYNLLFEGIDYFLGTDEYWSYEFHLEQFSFRKARSDLQNSF